MVGNRLTYADSGVDIDGADKFVDAVKKIVNVCNHHNTDVVGEIGGFGGLFSLNTSMYEKPVLVSSTDGVGTKLKIAFMMDKHDTVGIDLVAMCVNDVAVCGAKPLFFLDYFATGKLDFTRDVDVIKGIAEGCRQAECVLIGGETAEMPGLYVDGEYDLAGFCVGGVNHNNIIDGSKISKGDVIIGVSSSGLHSNGFSLVRKICFDKLGMSVHTYLPDFGCCLGEILLTPTRIYSTLINNLIKSVKINGMAHITGGGITENIKRVIPKPYDFIINPIVLPPIFEYLRDLGRIENSEMLRVFNNGIGLAIVVSSEDFDIITNLLKQLKETFCVVGEVV